MVFHAYMLRKTCFSACVGLFCMLLWASNAKSQTISFQAPRTSVKHIRSGRLPALRLPSPVAQLSWLCRQELAVERKLPVGLWMKLGDPAEPPVAWPRPPAYMRLKLLRF